MSNVSASDARANNNYTFIPSFVKGAARVSIPQSDEKLEPLSLESPLKNPVEIITIPCRYVQLNK